MKRIISFYMCFAMCVALFAQATDLTIDNQTPGWLSSKIDFADQQTVRNLKVTGYVNSTDLKFIGSLIKNRSLDGCINLSDVNVVGSTRDNYMGEGSFGITKTPENIVRKLMLPRSITKLEHCLSNMTIDTLIFEPNDMKYVEYYFFWGKFSHLILGGAVDSIPGQQLSTLTSAHCFSLLSWLKSVQFPLNMKYIGDCAFCNHPDKSTNLPTGIEDININELQKLEYIGAFAFTNYHGQKGRSSNYQPDTLKLMSVKTLNSSAFAYKEGQHIYFGDAIEEILVYGNYGFAQNLIFHMKSKTPPSGIAPDKTCTVYVPKGSIAAYKNSAWKNAIIIEEKPLEEIKCTPQSVMLEKGEQKLLNVSFVPFDADDKKLTWSSEDTSIATVDEDGVVTAVAPGTTKIHATSVATGVTSSCEVTVIQHAQSIQMETPEVTLTQLGETKQLKAIVLPENTTDKSVKWISSNPAVCTVTSSGMIVAMGYGEAVVMAITNDGELPATCVVKVVQKKYKLTYMVDGTEYKSYEMASNSVIIPEAAPTKEGYTFSGWSEVPSTMPSHDVTVTGSFTVNKYKLTYMLDGEIYKTYKVTYGTPITPETEPTKDNCIFSGWSEIPATMPANDVVVIGTFTLVDAIDDIMANDSNYLIFTLDGRPSQTLQKGVNIIRMSDGTRKKVFVR